MMLCIVDEAAQNHWKTSVPADFKGSGDVSARPGRFEPSIKREPRSLHGGRASHRLHERGHKIVQFLEGRPKPQGDLLERVSESTASVSLSLAAVRAVCWKSVGLAPNSALAARISGCVFNSSDSPPAAALARS